MTENKIPEILAKYYTCDNYSCDALLNSYLWASYPLQFNDPFDCSEKLWDLRCFTRKAVLEYMDRGVHFLFENCLSHEERRKLFIELMSPGIICLNEPNLDDSDILWGYYTNQEGFCIEFNTNFLVKNWSNKPRHVFYNPKPELLKKFKLEDLHTSFEKWALIKKRIWNNEEEWRFIFTDTNGYHPIFNIGDKAVRQKKYIKDAIENVTLGYKFFNEQVNNQRSKLLTGNTKLFTFLADDNPYRWSILSFLYEKGIETFQIELSENMRLIKRKIQILKMEKGEVLIYYFDDSLKK